MTTRTPLRRGTVRHVSAAALVLAAGLLGAGAAGAQTPPADPAVAQILRGDIWVVAGTPTADRFGAFDVPSAGMLPSIKEGDVVITDRQRAATVTRGDVVVFLPTPAQRAKCGTGADERFIKRVVAVGGDRVDVAAGQVLVNGAEFVVAGATAPAYTVASVVVPAGQVYVLGDNRGSSCDSHSWASPGVPIAQIDGRAEAIAFPRARVGFVTPAGAVTPFDVSGAPTRARAEYLVTLTRSASPAYIASGALRKCAKKASCARSLTARHRAAGRAAAGLAGKMTAPARALGAECGAAPAKALRAELQRLARGARRGRVTRAKSLALSRNIDSAIAKARTKVGACWTA
ncbi:MAG: signal peptidase I [Thermoleophilia bacterium]|nr:signal peptidase I [Thermoleophilia bacterium]